MGLDARETEFMEFWEKALEPFSLPDAIAAVGEMVRDPRLPRTLPLDRLPLVLEYAEKVRRDRKQSKPLAMTPGVLPSEKWDAALLASGAIDKKEFNRRQRARKESK